MRLCATAKPAESGDGMKIERHDPSAGLKTPVKTFMTVGSQSGTVNRVPPPGTSTVMAFRLKGAAAPLLFGAVLATAATLHARVGGAIQSVNSPGRGKKVVTAVTQTAEMNRAVVRRLYEDALSTGRLELLDQLVSEGYEGPAGQKGPAGFAETIRELRQAFPDIRWTVEDLVAEGDRVAVRSTWRGTHKGRFREFPASDKQVTNSGVAIYQFEDGKIVRAWVQTDRLGFLQQLGVVPHGLGHHVEPRKAVGLGARSDLC